MLPQTRVRVLDVIAMLSAIIAVAQNACPDNTWTEQSGRCFFSPGSRNRDEALAACTEVGAALPSNTEEYEAAADAANQHGLITASKFWINRAESGSSCFAVPLSDLTPTKASCSFVQGVICIVASTSDGASTAASEVETTAQDQGTSAAEQQGTTAAAQQETTAAAEQATTAAQVAVTTAPSNTDPPGSTADSILLDAANCTNATEVNCTNSTNSTDAPSHGNRQSPLVTWVNCVIFVHVVMATFWWNK